MTTREKPTMNGSRIARLYEHHPKTGELIDIELDFGLWKTEGVLPDAGDVIIDHGVPAGKDRTKRTHRTVYEVVRRYFGLEDSKHVAIIVEAREGQENEIDMFDIY